MDQRLSYVVFYFRGEALSWFKLMHRNNQLRSWTEFTRAVELRFGPSLYEIPKPICSNFSKHILLLLTSANSSVFAIGFTIFLMSPCLIASFWGCVLIFSMSSLFCSRLLSRKPWVLRSWLNPSSQPLVPLRPLLDPLILTSATLICAPTTSHSFSPFAHCPSFTPSFTYPAYLSSNFSLPLNTSPNARTSFSRFMLQQR